MTASATSAARMERARRRFLSPLAVRGYFLARLPMAWFAGLRVQTLTADRCQVVVPRGWRTQNPFRSTYFGAQLMAAELSTGALVMLATEAADAPVSMLVTELHTTFEKKAVSDAVFTCDDGALAQAAVAETLRTGEGATARMESVGRLADGTVVSRVHFVWSVKRKSR